MNGTPGRAPRGGIGRLAIGAGAFVLFAPAALAALPLAALLAVSRPRARQEWLVATLAGGYALWWLLRTGEPPEQLLRAAAVIATAVFVLTTLRTRASFIHRGGAAVGSAAVALYGLATVFGTSWHHVRWWVEHQTGLAARMLVGRMWAAARGDAVDGMRMTFGQLEAGFAHMVPFVADFYPGLAALQLLAGLALATAVYGRVAREPVGRPLGRLRVFRFTEHLGWAAAVPLVVVLVPKLAAAKTAAANLLLVTGVLYALRGVAVAAFGLQAAGAGGVMLWVLGGLVVFLMLPVLIGGAIVIGVVDAGLDLRRRWTSAASGE